MRSSDELPTNRGVDHPSDGIDHIVDTISSLYAPRIGEGTLYFNFEIGFLSLFDLLYNIVSSVGHIRWPIEKEEIARTWRNPIIIPQGYQPHDFPNFLSSLRLSDICIDTPLNPRYINLVAQHVQIPAPIFLNPLDMEVASPRSPTNEVMLTTFWTDWFRDRDAYMKRIIIPCTTEKTTLMVCQSVVGSTACLYSLTCLPHYHPGCTIWSHNPGAPNSQFITRPLTCSTNNSTSPGYNVTCIVWNSMGASIPTLLGILDYLLIAENPHVLILTHTWLNTTDISVLVLFTGLTGHCIITPENGFPGLCILWNPGIVTRRERPAFQRGLHLLLEVPNLLPRPMRRYNS